MGRQDLRKIPFERPDVAPLFADLHSTMLQESDRGAVLVGAATVDAYLAELFRSVATKRMSQKRLRRLLNHGPLSSLSARAEVALAVDLISRSLHRSIDLLRRLRNDAAHSHGSFRLGDHQQRLREMLDLGPGMPAAINRIAAGALIDGLLGNIGETEAARRPTERLFESPRDVLDYLSESPRLLDQLQERAYRHELATGVALICVTLAFAKNMLVGDTAESESASRSGV